MIEVVQPVPVDSIMILLELLAKIPLYEQYLPPIIKGKGFYKNESENAEGVKQHLLVVTSINT